MSWLPKWIVINGLFAGETPHGTLNGVPAYLDNNFGYSSDYAFGGGGYHEDPFTHEGYEKWDGAYGSNARSMLQYAQQHGASTDVLLAEFNVRAAQGATYYKQTIAFYGDINYQHGQDQTHEWDWFQPIVKKVCRLVYADPQSPPYISHTWTYVSANAPTGYSLINGDPATFDNNWLFDNLRCGFGYLTVNDTEYFGAFIYSEVSAISAGEHVIGTDGYLLAVSCETLSEAYDINFTEDPLPDEKDDPNEEEPPEDGPGKGGGGGGEGPHVLPDENVPIPPLPDIGAASISWLKLFKMTTSQLSDFGAQMTPKTAWQLLQAFFTNPLDAIIGIMLIPVDAPTAGARTPAIGDFSWDKAYPIMDTEFYELNCGSINIPPYWDSAFDFSTFTKIQIFLPFIGYRDIDVDEIMGGTVTVKYHIDVCTGDCTAFIMRSASSESIYGHVKDQVIAQYNGNCGTRVPTGRVSHDSAISASMSLLGAAFNVGGAIVGAALGDVSSISASQVANQVSGGTMTAVNGMKRQVQRSGNIAAAAGYMGILRPYIIRQIPRQDLPKEYKRLEGYPANKGGTLAQFAGTGLNCIEAMELTGFNGFDSERDELLSILRGGVIV